MLRALGHPVSFLGLLIGFLAAIAVCSVVQRGCARMLGIRVGPRAPGATGWLDPYGAVAAVLGGPGWGPTVTPAMGSRARRCLVLLSGPAAAAVLGAAGIAAFATQDGGRAALYGRPGLGDVLSGLDGPAKLVLPLCAGLEAVTVALLALVPLPPLSGWGILSIFVKPTASWQRARMYLEERNIGVLILLVLLALPLGGGLPILVEILDWLVGLILRAVAGG